MSALVTACTGLVALGVAMGIGRFAFTPVLPMMQAEAGVTIAQGGWLAAANYAGYLAGALLATLMRSGSARSMRGALLAVGMTTLAMGFTASFPVWVALRFLAGVASAWVLVFVSTWALERIAAEAPAAWQRREALNATVFAGVGAGIAAAGLLVLALMAVMASAADAWIALGAVALAGSLLIWKALGEDAQRAANGAGERHWPVESVRLVFAYGALGFGYIVPATFLPVMAKRALDDPALFGWSWPVFGAAAAASTFVAARWRRRWSARAVWIASQCAMAAGVAIPVAWPALGAIAISALLVGGTFMVVTMVGIQEARRVAGSGARTLIAAMTSAFGAGQIAGPLLVSALAGRANAFSVALACAALTLAAGALLLLRIERTTG
jgi:MFS family permease